MKNWIAFIAVVSVSLGSIGCTTCCSPHDYDYPTFGGKHPRVDPSYGRVGSIFSDPNATMSGPDADSNLTPMTEQRSRGSSEEFNRNLQDNRESIDPIDGLQTTPDAEGLPTPPNVDGNSPTASRLHKNPPLRSFQNLR